MRTARSYIEEAKAYLHSFIIRNYVQVSGQIHTSVAHDWRRALYIHGIGGWVGLKTGMNASEKMYMLPFAGIETRIF